MREHPKSLYFSASWRESDQKLSRLVAGAFAKKGFLLVGDHPYYKDHPHERGLTYEQRVEEILEDCSGIVFFWPNRQTEQTTSPYMFAEALLASRHGLPVFLACVAGVKMHHDDNQGDTILTFGKDQAQPALDLARMKQQGYSDKLLEQTFSINILKPLSVVGPVVIPADPSSFSTVEHDLNEAVDRFSAKLPQPATPHFVFNIIPFIKDREHLTIARVVLEETGLPCYTAEDHRDSNEDITKRRLEYLDRTTFLIADLSTARETCALEVGVALGKGKDVHIVTRRSLEELPFGTHTRPVFQYESLAKLGDAVRTICQPYRKRLINTELVKLDSVEAGASGLPRWYFDQRSLSLGARLLVFSILLSVAVGVAFAATVHVLAPTEVLLPIGSGFVIAVFGVAVSSFGKLQQFLEKWVAARIAWCTWGASLFLVASIVWLAVTIFSSRTETPQGKAPGTNATHAR